LNKQNASQADREWASKQACEMLQIEYCENDMSARTLCVLAYFCVMAGMQGEVGNLPNRLLAKLANIRNIWIAH
jgi:hypothetical protein